MPLDAKDPATYPEGDLQPFLPLLAAAELTHVGKGATFGLGRLRVVASS